jgi:hypothetical protein
MKERDAKGRFLTGHKVNAYSEEQMHIFFDAYCKHRALGKDKESFSKDGCHFQTVEKWVNASIDTTIHARAYKAEAEGHLFWETFMLKVGLGIPAEMPTAYGPHLVNHQNIQPHMLIFMMRSKYPETYGNQVKQIQPNSLEDYMTSKPFEVINTNGKTIDTTIDDIKDSTKPTHIKLFGTVPIST